MGTFDGTFDLGPLETDRIKNTDQVAWDDRRTEKEDRLRGRWRRGGHSGRLVNWFGRACLTWHTGGVREEETSRCPWTLSGCATSTRYRLHAERKYEGEAWISLGAEAGVYP
jgi:hypothetical protein